MPLSVASQSRLLTLFSSEFLCIVTSLVTSHIAPNPRAKMGGTYIKVMPTAFLIVSEHCGITATSFPKQTPIRVNKFNRILSIFFFFNHIYIYSLSFQVSRYLATEFQLIRRSRKADVK